MPHKAMNLRQAAAFLHMTEADVRSLAMHGEIPFERPGDNLLFRRGELKAWCSRRVLGLRGRQLRDYHGAGILQHYEQPGHVGIATDLSEAGSMAPALRAKTRAAVLREMVSLAEGTGFLYDPADLVEELEQREALSSTGIEGGIALLHPRHHDPYMVEESFVCIGRTPRPIPFGSPDGRATDLFFLVCCDDDRTHLLVLARVCMLCHDTDLPARLRAAASAEEMYAALAATEKVLLASL